MAWNSHCQGNTRTIVYAFQILASLLECNFDPVPEIMQNCIMTIVYRTSNQRVFDFLDINEHRHIYLNGKTLAKVFSSLIKKPLIKKRQCNKTISFVKSPQDTMFESVTYEASFVSLYPIEASGKHVRVSYTTLHHAFI